MIHRYDFIWCSRCDNTGIVAGFRIHENGAVHITVRGSRIQIIQTDKGTDFRTLSIRNTVLQMNGTHIIKDNLNFINDIRTGNFQGCNGFVLTCSGIPHQHNTLAFSAL